MRGDGQGADGHSRSSKRSRAALRLGWQTYASAFFALNIGIRFTFVAISSQNRTKQKVEENAEHDRGQKRPERCDKDVFHTRNASNTCWERAGRYFTSGNKMVSRMPRPVSAISKRSIPIPIPPDGGMPCSSAFKNSSSTRIASSSPAAASAA